MSGDTIPEKDRLSARLVHVIVSIVTCQGKHFVHILCHKLCHCQKYV